MEIKTLKTQLADWTDIDFAQFYLARCLGLLDAEDNFSGKAKHIFWSDNPVGNALFRTLQELVSIGALEKRDEPDFQYKWSEDFKGTW